MPMFESGALRLHYEEAGSGFPILLFAPGGMKSAIPFWEMVAWDPVGTLSQHYRVITMDQRNAGRSTAPITADDGWHSYAADHIALLDHLGIERAHVLGVCIGGPYCLGAIEAAPTRIAAAVLQQPIGLEDNREAFHQMFDSWADELRPERPEVDAAAWSPFRERMYGGDFVFNVSRDFVSACATPMLVLMGNDLYHPQSTSREIAALAPNATLVEQWKEPEDAEATQRAVLDFLAPHTP